jgi:hypothetical protein
MRTLSQSPSRGESWNDSNNRRCGRGSFDAGHFKHRQKPSSARPTQLNAKIEEAIATTDAKVAIALTDDIPESNSKQRSNSAQWPLLNQGVEFTASNIESDCD